jgi:hypothetical protein
MTDIDKTPVAGEIVTRCTKCKLELRHVVISHNKEGLVAKVKCNTCGSEHKYYPEKKRLATKKKKEEAAKVAQRNREAEKFARLLEQNQGKKAKTYGMSENYSDSDVIDHKTFGKGIITKVNYQKMDVLFETGLRILACNKLSIM